MSHPAPFRLDRPARRAPRENVVPMINVVFLLLVFFMMMARMTPPAPVEVTPPAGTAAPAPDAGRALYVAADGTLGYGAARGDAALDQAARRAGDAPLVLRADADLPGSELTALVTRLAAAGVTRVSLVTERE